MQARCVGLCNARRSVGQERGEGGAGRGGQKERGEVGMVPGRVDRRATGRALQGASIRGQLQQVFGVYPFSCKKQNATLKWAS